MDDPLAMGAFQRIGDVARKREGSGDIQRTSLQPLGERFAVEVLEHQVVDAGVAPDVEERADVGMVEGRDGLGLALETGPQVGVGRREDLDRDRPPQPRVARPIDLAEPARADLGDELVGAEARAACQGHAADCTRVRRVNWPRARPPWPTCP
jgi:hypothetical protein